MFSFNKEKSSEKWRNAREAYPEGVLRKTWRKLYI